MDYKKCNTLDLLKVFPLYGVPIVGIHNERNDEANPLQNLWVVRTAHKAAHEGVCLVKIQVSCI